MPAGYTSIWSLFIYSIGVFVNERLYLRMRGSVPAVARGVVYVCWVYLWEYCTGYALDLAQARPWNYTELSYNIHGLIALEFAPLWYAASLLSEQFLIKTTLTLSWPGQPSDEVLRLKKTPGNDGDAERNGWTHAELANGDVAGQNLISMQSNGTKQNGRKKQVKKSSGGKQSSGGKVDDSAGQAGVRRRMGLATNAKPASAKRH